jgi:C-terminal peptidase prc
VKRWFSLAAVLVALVLATPGALAAAPVYPSAAASSSAASSPTPSSSSAESPSPAPETQAPETEAPETQAPETAAPVTEAPESPAPGSPGPSPNPSPEPSGSACPTSTAPNPSPSIPVSIPQELRLALFQAIWQAVDQNYVDPAHNGVDWAGTRTTYFPEINIDDDAAQVYSLLGTMVSALKDPYSYYLSSDQVTALSSGSTTYGGIGTLLDPNDTSGPGVRILFVFPGGPADQGGLKSRDRIVAVDGDPCVSIDKIRGDVGSTVTLTVQSPGGQPHDIQITRGSIAGVIPPLAERMKARNGTVGYLRLASMNGQGTAVEDALRGFMSKNPVDGLVIDLRGTTLGGSGSLTDLLGQFVHGNVGSFYSRTQTAPLTVDPLDLNKTLAKVPIVVLVDSHTSGEAEQFAAILQSQKRAKIIGQQTAGRSDLAQPVDYPDGSRLVLVTAGLELPNGTKLQDHGVTPDMKINADWLSVAEKDDPYLKAALRALQ